MMTNRGTVSVAHEQSWVTRRHDAKAFRRDAEVLLTTAVEGQNCNPILVLAIHAVIAFGDALTAKFGTVINRQHDDLPKQVQAALKGRADPRQLDRLRDLLGNKTAYSYGAKTGRINDAQDAVLKMQRFADWAEELLTQR